MADFDVERTEALAEEFIQERKIYAVEFESGAYQSGREIALDAELTKAKQSLGMLNAALGTETQDLRKAEARVAELEAAIAEFVERTPELDRPRTKEAE